MSEKMYPIPFRSLMNWVVTEYADCGEIFGIHKAYRASGKSLPIFGERIETPFGPAAGPNSQLAQNIIAAYVAGARFFEVKTVQKMDGADLAACVPRPCILANDEGYNQEWSTELTVPQAMDEYIKAWCALKVLSKVYDLGDPDGFVFNMSVGYDLEGIKGEKVNTYIDGMMDARRTAIFGECKAVLKELFPAESDFIDAISPRVSGSVTVSTLHGCPPDEIERIASYLISEKHLHTFVKCNPTILGYETARRTLDAMGYDYIVFDEHHFNEDLQWADAVPMFQRLQKLADSCGLEFGLKLSNTFPVDTTRGELPNNEMYMSGRSLFPLTIEMCHRISRQFGGRMRISFAGGAEYFNCDKLFAAGIWPITVATTILKPGGYNRLLQMVEKVEALPYRPFSGTDTQAICDLSTASHTDFHHVKPIKPLPSRKSDKQVPWLDCFTAPCKGGCPIEQDIPEYVELVRKGLYGPALKLITEKNPLPFLTGTICAHRCQTKCSRNFYDESVRIRDTKLVAAERGYEALMASIRRPAKVAGKKAAIIGGGPTGMSAAYFVGRAGIPVTLFEKADRLGGIVRQKQRLFHLVACGGEHFDDERAAFVLPFTAAALVGKGDDGSPQGRILRRGQQGHFVAHTDLAAGNYPGKHALPRHDAFAGLLLDDTIVVAFLADLGHLQYHVSDGKPAGDRKGAEVKPFDDQIFAKGTVVHPDFFAEGFDLFSAQHTDLAVPIAAVGVAHDAPFRGEHGAGHLGLDGAAPGACADGQNFTHKMLSSDAVHAACRGHAPVLKMMLPGFGPDGLPDDRPQPGVVGPAAQQSTQVTPGLAGKAGTQKALTRQPYPVAGGAEFAVHGGNEANAALPAGHGIIDGRAIAKGGAFHGMQFRPAVGKPRPQFRAGDAGHGRAVADGHHLDEPHL